MESHAEQIILNKLDAVLKEVESLKTFKQPPQRIPLVDFCKQRQISRPTCYSWSEKGLIQLEKIGGRQFVKADSVTVVNKYERQK